MYWKRNGYKYSEKALKWFWKCIVFVEPTGLVKKTNVRAKANVAKLDHKRNKNQCSKKRRPTKQQVTVNIINATNVQSCQQFQLLR